MVATDYTVSSGEDTMAKSPRHALRDLANSREIDGEVFEELFGLATGTIAGAEHRALAIVGAAVLEDALRDAISEHLNPRRDQLATNNCSKMSMRPCRV